MNLKKSSEKKTNVELGIEPVKSNITFKDVAGIKEIKRGA